MTQNFIILWVNRKWSYYLDVRFISSTMVVILSEHLYDLCVYKQNFLRALKD